MQLTRIFLQCSILVNLAILTNTSLAKTQLPIDDTAKLKMGINVGLINDGYNIDNSISIMPHAFYDNNRLYIEGAEGGFYPYKTQDTQVRLGITYDGRTFDPNDGKNANLQALDKRKFSVLAHASVMRITPIGGFRLKVATDTTNRHEGLTASFAHLSKFQFFDEKLTVYPSIGIAWYSDDYNQYYYGISQAESAKTGMTSYTPKSDTNPYVSITGEYVLSDKWSIFGNGRAEKLSSQQKNSPLVKDSIATTLRIGVSHSF